MKVISLNVWGGGMFDHLLSYLQEQAKDTDIFCFQEVFHTETKHELIENYRANLFSELQKVLISFQGYFAGAQEGYVLRLKAPFPIDYGLALFVRKDIEIKGVWGNEFIYRERNARKDESDLRNPRNIQYTLLKRKDQKLLIAHFHGLWHKGPKNDTFDRLVQSFKVKEILNRWDCEKILCGDFNLLPHTRSLAILKEGMKELVTQFCEPTTRPSFYNKSDCFADYLLISPGLKIEEFYIDKKEVSDHLALILKIK